MRVLSSDHDAVKFIFRIKKRLLTLKIFIKKQFKRLLCKHLYIDKMFTQKSQKNDPIFHCENCDYSSSKKSDYTKHISTRKHRLRSECLQKVAKVAHLKCLCGKEYSCRQSLHTHKKKCGGNDNIIIHVSEPKENYQELVMTLIKENAELKDMMMNVIEKGTTTYNTTHNSFNLNFFLNETCKNAMNINDFVNSVSVQLQDLEKFGQNGYINGMSDIIVSHLNKMDVSKRPMHCTDRKRETLYVKDENKWEKEEKEKPRLKHAIRKLSQQNVKLMLDYQKKYPDCLNTDSVYNEKYNELIAETFGNGDKDLDKIIKKISKEIKIGNE